MQNSILDFVRGLGKVDNYKVILKSVNKIHQMLKGNLSDNIEAEPIGIDQNVIEEA